MMGVNYIGVISDSDKRRFFVAPLFTVGYGDRSAAASV
jgi:hypothetical protein